MNYAINHISSYLILILSFIFCIGCSDDNSTGPDTSLSRETAFAGTWELTKITITDANGTYDLTPEEAHYTATIIAKEDRSLTITTTSNGQQSVQTGTWSVNVDFLVLTINGNNNMLPYTAEDNKFTMTTYYQTQNNVTATQVLEFTKQ